MDKFLIKGPCELKGEVEISGSKNAALPIITATLLAQGRYVLSNIPDLRDIKTILTILKGMGVEYSFEGNRLTIDSGRITNHKAPYELVKTMRASIYVMGPLLAVHGMAEVALPGGCTIGVRPIDIHLKGFEKLGAKIELNKGFVIAKARKLKGTEIFFDKVSVGATANILMACVLAEGKTKIFNAACEPEITDLINFLNAMGAKIDGAGTGILTITGVRRLHPVSYSVIPDRIEAGTFALAAVITKSEITIRKVCNEHLRNLYQVFDKAGVNYGLHQSGVLTIRRQKKLFPVDIATSPYPGFATDFQPQVTAFLSLVKGKSVVNETVFENRFMHIPELNRMGANIHHDEHLAIISGVTRLTGAPVMASDLRAGAALVLAGLAARGETVVDRIYHIDRGYEGFERKLSALGADITRIS